jgi:hypothetical protein
MGPREYVIVYCLRIENASVKRAPDGADWTGNPACSIGERQVRS